jgi:hypothetical protein
MSEELYEIVTDFFNAIEAAAVNAKRQIAEVKGVAEKEEKQAKKTWDPEKIKWTQAEGASGPYERSEDANNLDHKAMLKDLAAHKGKLNREGLFYWTFQNGVTVGRKKKK